MYSEDDFLSLSGLQHLAFCPRQCALIHLEGAWEENRLSAEGRVFHERVHEGVDGLESGRVVLRGLRLVSQRFGLVGVADVVEMEPAETGVSIDGRRGFWRPFPVEYKRGKSKIGNEDRIQLCAQALCLEEHWDIGIPSGALYYGRTRRRESVVFSNDLRCETELTISAFRELVSVGVTPPATKTPKCRNCSLREICIPNAVPNVQNYLARMIKAARSDLE